MTELLEAAQARMANVRNLADRPSQRSNSAEGRNGARPFMTARLNNVKFRLSAPAGMPTSDPDGNDDTTSVIQFDGYASTTEQPYCMFDAFGPYNEIISLGAFGQTLASNPDVPLVLQHDPLRRIARTVNGTLQLSEDTDGLHVLAQLDPADADVAYIVPKMRSGLIDEMSFAFTITAGQWSPDYTEFRITAVDINRGDVSIVGYGANPDTSAQITSRNLSDVFKVATVEELRAYQEQINARLFVPEPVVIERAKSSMSLTQALLLP